MYMQVVFIWPVIICIWPSMAHYNINNIPGSSLPGDSKDLPGDLILYFVMSKVQDCKRHFFFL